MVRRQSAPHFYPINCVVPVRVETLGSFGESEDNVIRICGREIISETEKKRSTDLLRQLLSVAIQRGNAVCVLASADTMVGNLGDGEFFYL